MGWGEEFWMGTLGWVSKMKNGRACIRFYHRIKCIYYNNHLKSCFHELVLKIIIKNIWVYFTNASLISWCMMAKFCH